MVVDSRMKVIIYPSTTVAVFRGLFVLRALYNTLLDTNRRKKQGDDVTEQQQQYLSRDRQK
jgi:hypothetical protein